MSWVSTTNTNQFHRHWFHHSFSTQIGADNMTRRQVRMSESSQGGRKSSDVFPSRRFARSSRLSLLHNRRVGRLVQYADVMPQFQSFRGAKNFQVKKILIIWRLRRSEWVSQSQWVNDRQAWDSNYSKHNNTTIVLWWTLLLL